MTVDRRTVYQRTSTHLRITWRSLPTWPPVCNVLVSHFGHVVMAVHEIRLSSWHSGSVYCAGCAWITGFLVSNPKSVQIICVQDHACFEINTSQDRQECLTLSYVICENWLHVRLLMLTCVQWCTDKMPQDKMPQTKWSQTKCHAENRQPDKMPQRNKQPRIKCHNVKIKRLNTVSKSTRPTSYKAP